MDINSTNINKTNNYLTSSLNSLKTKRSRHVTLEIQVLAWDKNVAGECGEFILHQNTIEINSFRFNAYSKYMHAPSYIYNLNLFIYEVSFSWFNNEKNNVKIPHCRDSSKIQQKKSQREETSIHLAHKYMTVHFPDFVQALQ